MPAEMLTTHKTLRVLLVENSPTATQLIRFYLRESCESLEEVICVSTLRAALEFLRSDRADVVMLSLDLPESEEVDVYHTLHRAHRELPVVVITHTENQSLAMQAVRAGAQDYLIREQLDFNPVGRAVQFSLERGIRQHHEREIQAARTVQQALYPTHGPVFPGYDFAGFAFPAEDTCGDYFDFIPMLEESVGLVVGDVSGHGLGPALKMMETRAYLRSLADMWHYVRLVAREDMTVGDLLTHANRMLCQSDTEHFVTLFVARLEPSSRQLTYSSGGHRGYLLRANGHLETLPSTGPMLGMLPGILIPAARPIQLYPGDLLFLPTDGLEEALNPEGEQFGQERMLNALRESRDLSARQIIDSLHTAAAKFRRGFPPHDDITALVLKVLE